MLPRHNGEVFIRGDLAVGHARYWDGVAITREQQEAIDEVGGCRTLRERLLQGSTAARALREASRRRRATRRLQRTERKDHRGVGGGAPR